MLRVGRKGIETTRSPAAAVVAAQGRSVVVISSGADSYTEDWEDLANGASYVRPWLSGAGSWIPGNGNNIPVISNTRAFSGLRSLKVPYAATASGGANAEVEVAFGGNYREVICEYYIYTPANYLHRNVNSSSYNNKQFRLFSSQGYTTSEKVGMTTEPNGGGSTSYIFSEWDPDGTGVTQLGTPYATWINPTWLGQWMYVKWRVRAPTAKGSGRGILQAWQGTSPVDAVMRLNETPDNFIGSEPHTYAQCKLMGTADSGFAQLTEFNLDLITFTLIP